MFSYDIIQTYNETDILIYKYIISNIEKVQYMTIRELANELHLSTSTVLRFCHKNNYTGYAEFKEAIKKEISTIKTHSPLEDLQEFATFFARANSSAFEEKLSTAVKFIQKASLVIFLGMGSSGTLAKYGARYFSNIGKFSVGLEDVYYPINTYTYENVVVIALSESGESSEVINIVKQFQQKNCYILSITNSAQSTLAKISDWNFSYNFNQERVNGGYNITTQVPVLFVIESLAKRI